MSQTKKWRACGRSRSSGFSLLELMASVAILTLVVGAVFEFMAQSQKRFQGNTVISESNQAARTGLEAISQEIGQAGFNPQFTSPITSGANLTHGGPQCITVSNIAGINPGDWVGVDTGPNYEQVQVVATTNGAISGQTACAGSKQISATFANDHNGSSTAFPLFSYKFPYPAGILQNQTVTYGGSNVTISNDHILALFYGDTDNSGNTWYVVYSLYNPTSSGSLQSVTINGQSYNLYTLYRSITQVTFSAGVTVTQAYPLVQNVLYQSLSNSSVGPTNQPIFTYAYPVSVLVPSTITIVGTVKVNLCVAVNPNDLETGVVQWYTMATQIRPTNLWSAVTATQNGGGKYLTLTPPGLPMAFPGQLSSYYVY